MCSSAVIMHKSLPLVFALPLCSSLYFSGTVIRDEVKVTLSGSTSNTVVTVDCTMLRVALLSSALKAAQSLKS